MILWLGLANYIAIAIAIAIAIDILDSLSTICHLGSRWMGKETIAVSSYTINVY